MRVGICRPFLCHLKFDRVHKLSIFKHCYTQVFLQKIGIIFLTLALCKQLQGQRSFRFKHWGVEDGLSQSTITQITQDKDGFIWLGTQDGLNRFDGYSFKIYRNKENNEGSLSNNYIMSLACDSAGYVWVGTTNGLNRIHPSTHKVERIPLNKVFPSATNYRIHALCAAPGGGVYVATAFTIFYVDIKADVYRLPNIESVLPLGTNSIVRDGNNLFFSASKKIWYYSSSTQSLKAITTECSDVTVLAANEKKIVYRCANELYTLALSGANKYKSPTKIKRVINNQSVLSVFLDNNHEWICTDNGLICCRSNDTLLLRHEETNEQSLSSDFVYTVLRDKNGDYWVGTGRGGLCFLKHPGNEPQWLGKKEGITESVWHTAVFNDTLYVATSRGIQIFKNKSKQRLSSAAFADKVLEEIKIESLQAPLKDKLITAIDKDKTGRFWFGTESAGVYVYGNSSKKFSVITSNGDDANSLINNKVMYLSALNDSTMGACSAYGFSAIDTKTLKTKRIILSELKSGLNNYIMKAIEGTNCIWFSSANGLCKYSYASNTVNQFMPDQKHPEEQYHNIVSDAKIASDGGIWLTTMGYGLHRFSEKTKRFERFAAKEGLENENLLRVHIDANNVIWTASHDGIARFDYPSKRFINFSTEDGFGSKECTMNGLYESADGDLYVGMVGGLAIFDPTKLTLDSASISMVISDIKVNYDEIKNDNSVDFVGAFSHPNAITLFEKAKTISFEFSALRYGRSKSVSYWYKLKGFDQKWVQLPAGARLASYSSLPEGKYLFQVLPVLQGIPLFSKKMEFEIRVVPPYYKTWWFKVLLVIAGMTVLAAGLILFYRRKLRTQREKAEQELKLQKEKERISRELHDNVGSQLTYIIKSIDTLAYKSQKNPETISGGLDSLSDFSRDTLNQLRESIWAINTNQITLYELAAKMQDHITKINASISNKEIVLSQSLIDNRIINPALAIGIFRIFQESLVNSIKYANCHKTLVSLVQLDHETLSMVVEDKGQGFELGTTKSHSYGLKNMEARAIEFGGQLKISSKLGLGTKVELICAIK